jgi:hypothetical protein
MMNKTRNAVMTQKASNPYIGADYGNLMEEQMVLQEILAGCEEKGEAEMLSNRLGLISEAIRLRWED